MSTITAADVNKLRLQTGAGMMDCKKALVEAEGDFQKAIELLRKKGQKVAANRSDKSANEGLVIAQTDNSGKSGVILVLNCETDFVAKNDDFSGFAYKLADMAVKKNINTSDELLAQSFDGNGITVNDKILEYVGKIGEKIEISALHRIQAERVVAYNHPGNKVASIVGLNKDGEVITEAAKDIAMQIAAMSPIAIDKADVSKEIIEKEIEIGKEQARAEGKPENILEKIAIGKLNKFYQENTLLNQEFIKDNKKTVGQYLKEKDKDLTVTAFKRLSLV
jgi:elongation factor Ts